MINVQDLINIRVDEFTSPCLFLAKRETPVDEVLQMMQKFKIRHVPVVEGSKAIGIISERDLKVLTNIDAAKSFTAEEVMHKQPFSVMTGTCLDEVAFEMSSRKIGSSLVHDLEGNLLGIFTSTDALNALIEILRGQIPSIHPDIHPEM